MPAGHVMPFQMPPHTAPAKPSLRLRARVWMRRRALDAELAEGADPARNDELRLRAAQLRDPKHRARMAAGVARLLVIAERRDRSGVITPHGPYGPSAVLSNREPLVALANRLRDSRFDSVQGLALSSVLLQAARRPLTMDRRPRTLKGALRAALSAFDAPGAQAPVSLEDRRAPAGRAAA